MFQGPRFNFLAAKEVPLEGGDDFYNWYKDMKADSKDALPPFEDLLERLKETPIWEGEGLSDWYRDMKVRKGSGEEFPVFEEFLAKVSSGEIRLPFDLASLDIRIERERQQKSEEKDAL